MVELVGRSFDFATTRQIAILWTIVATCGIVAEDRIFLRDGLHFDGMADVQESRIVVKSGPRIVTFGARQLLKSEPSDAEPKERIVLSQPQPRAGSTLPALSRPPKLRPFDAFGRRTIIFPDPRKKDRESGFIQAVTEIYPTHVTLKSLSHNWRSTLDLMQVPSDQLVPMLVKSTNDRQQNWVRMLNLLMQANRFDEVRTLLKDFRDKFPDGPKLAEELSGKLNRLVVEKALASIQRAVAAGQLLKAKQIETALRGYTIPDAYTEKVATVGKDLVTIQKNLDDARKAVAGLSLAAESADREMADAALVEISANISLATLARLEPLMTLSKQPDIKPVEKLALALSGWSVGPNLAQKDIDFARKAWRQRLLVQKILSNANEVAADTGMAELKKLDARADLLLQMVPLLSASWDNPPPGGPQVVEIDIPNVGQTSYQVILPPEYDRTREYPTIIALHSQESTTERIAQYWKSQAADHGYIVIAPEYRPDRGTPYQYSTAEHALVLAALTDARKRLAVDPDRVYLTGYEMGAMAAWDIGMSHPDQFAGLIPIAGTPQFYCDRYVPNLEHLPVYAIEGQYDGDNAPVTQEMFLRLFTSGFDAIYVEYPGCGREMFPGELPTLFEWMDRKRRKPAPTQFKCTSARIADRRFYWLEADSFMPNATVAPELFKKAKFTPAKMEGKASDNNIVDVQANMLKGVSIYLPAKLVQLDAPDLTIRYRSKVVHRGPVQPDWELMLRETRRTGDRKNLVVQRFRVSS